MTDFEQVFYQVFDYFKGDEKSFSHLSMVELARQITINLPKVVTQDSEPKIIFYPWKENKTFERCDFGTYNGMEFYIVSDCTKKRIKLYFHAA